MRLLAISMVALSCVGLGCGNAQTAPSDDVNVATGAFEVPAGDSFTCFYTDQNTSKELSIASASGQQGVGGHHILVYWTDTPHAVTHHACSDAEMVSWHQIAGSAGQSSTGAEGLVGLPDGAAIKVPAGKQLVIQSHYINATGAPQTVNDSATLHAVQPAQVKQYVNYLAHVDEGFQVPPQMQSTSATTCTLTRDYQAVLMLGHMHQYGKHYKMEQLDAQGANPVTLYEKEWSPVYTSHPPVQNYSLDQPLVLKSGTKLRQTCTWDNPTPNPLLFPIEMCVGFFYYFPDEGEQICTLDAQP